MADLYGLIRTFAIYKGDDGTNYTVATTVDNATAGGLTITTNPLAQPFFPRGYKMRHLYGEAGDGTRTKIPVGDPSSGQWTSATDFTKGPKTFNILGRIGEKRTLKGG